MTVWCTAARSSPGCWARVSRTALATAPSFATSWPLHAPWQVPIRASACLSQALLFVANSGGDLRLFDCTPELPVRGCLPAFGQSSAAALMLLLHWCGGLTCWTADQQAAASRSISAPAQGLLWHCAGCQWRRLAQGGWDLPPDCVPLVLQQWTSCATAAADRLVRTLHWAAVSPCSDWPCRSSLKYCVPSADSGWQCTPAQEQAGSVKLAVQPGPAG